MVTDLEEVTDVVFTVNVVLVVPAGIVTLVSTVAEALLLESEMTAPPAGAAEDNVTVPWEVLPPTTVVGLRAIELNAAGTGLTVSEAVRVTPLKTPDIVTGVEDETAKVFTVNVAVEEPAATVTLESTVAAALLLESETTAPPVGAAVVSTMVP